MFLKNLVLKSPCNANKHIISFIQTYPSPLPNPPEKKKGTVSSLVDQLLLDIYGLPDGDRRRSESDSTASSLKIRPQHQHLQKARLLWKSKSNSITVGYVGEKNREVVGGG